MKKTGAWLFQFLIVLLLVFGSYSQKAAANSVTGAWQNGPNFPFFPVHLHLLPNGKIMIWPGDGGVSGNDPRLYDPVSGSITSLAKPGFDVFCSGHSFLPDGRLFVA
ncbi:MAG TPA: hypothetical protein VFF74_03265, partial [Methylophilaceae bacterium]|nr:hypothetical protein [Methylophilaceae bacterium]